MYLHVKTSLCFTVVILQFNSVNQPNIFLCVFVKPFLKSLSCHPHQNDMKAGLPTQKANADLWLTLRLLLLLLLTFLSSLSTLSLGGSHKAPRSCLHLHPLEGVTLSSSSIRQDVPSPPVDAIGHAAVAPTVIPPIQVSCQTGVEPPACTVVLTAVPSCVAVMVSVSGAEGSAVVIVTFAVAQCVTCVTSVFPRC